MTSHPGERDPTPLEVIGGAGVLPIVELPSVAAVQPLFEALCASGLPVAEITLRTDAALDGISRARSAWPTALVGAGTVRTAQEAVRALDAGAQFVVTPGTDLDVVELCRARGVAIFPGALTPTEVEQAARAGAAAVKVFPVEAVGGARFVASLTGPYPDIRFLPTGGVNAGNLAGHLAVRNVVAAAGSWLVPKSLLAEGRFDRIEELVREALAIVGSVRRA